MTISPAQVEAEAVALARLYAEIELLLIGIITRQLRQGLDAPDWATVQLAGTRAIQQALRADVVRLEAAGSDRLGTLVQRAYLAGINGAVADLEAAGFGRSSLVRPHVTAAQAFIREAELNLRSTHVAILRQTEDVFRQAVAEGSRAAIGGAETRRSATQRILNQFADRGIAGFRDRAGRNWSLDTYAEMAARTAMGRAGVQAFLDTAEANGNDLVIVSDSPEECELCRPWENRVLSVSGRSSGRVTMGGGIRVNIAGSVADATQAGLFHPNLAVPIDSRCSLRATRNRSRTPRIPRVTKSGCTSVTWSVASVDGNDAKRRRWMMPAWSLRRTSGKNGSAVHVSL